MKLVKEKVKATSVDYVIDIEYKSEVYQIVFWYDIGENTYNNMEFVEDEPIKLHDNEVEKIKQYALSVFKTTDVFSRINEKILKRKYL
jgi:hypothetical protein